MLAGSVRGRMSGSPQSSRASVGEWAQTVLLVGNLAWTTLCLGGYRPETMVVTSVLTGALLAINLAARGFERDAARRPMHPAGWFLLPFLVYAAINVAWVTPVRWLGWRDWFGWAEMIAVFWVVLNGVRAPATRRTLFVALVALGVVAVLLACYQRFVRPDWLMLHRVQAEQFIGRASGPFGIPNSLAAFLLLLLPALGALTFRRGAGAVARVFCGWLTLVFGFGLVLTISRGAWLGLGLALVIWPLAAGRGGWRRRIGTAMLVTTGLVAAGGTLYATVPRVHDRIAALIRDAGETSRPIIWRVAWKLFREHPLVGTGAASYNVLFEKYRPEGFLDQPQWAHNDYLNTLSDYGLVGFGLFFGASGLIAWRCLRARRDAPVDAPGWLDSRATTAALGVGLLAFAFQLFVDFHFKIPALALGFAVMAALAVQGRWPVTRTTASSLSGRVMGVAAAGAALSLVWFFVRPAFEAEALRYRARQSIDQLAGKPENSPDYRDRLAESRDMLARAVAIAPGNAQAWADVAYAASLRAHIFPKELPALGVEAETAAARALSISPDCVEFWVRQGVARDMRGRWYDGSLDFAHAVTLAPDTSWVWFYYADHLSRKSTERGLTEAALALCLRLDPRNPDGLALRQRLAISQSAAP